MVPKGMRIARDMTGYKQPNGRLTVLHRADEMRKNDKHVLWICRCECGKVTHPITGRSIRLEYTRSCGCLSADANRRSRKQLVEKTCIVCKRPYKAVIWSRCCSLRCKDRKNRELRGDLKPVVLKSCRLCGREFKTHLSAKKYCSKKCGCTGVYQENADKVNRRARARHRSVAGERELATLGRILQAVRQQTEELE